MLTASEPAVQTYCGPFEIWKYEFDEPNPKFDVPEPAQLLKVAPQGDKIVAWFKVIPATASRKGVEFLCLNTGQSFASVLDDRMTFVDTVQINHIVWHIFTIFS